MAVLLAAYDCCARDPIKLNRAAWTGERDVAVPRVTAATERQQRAFGRWHFLDHVIEIGPGTQQPQASAGRFPSRVHVNEDRDDFRFRICVDLPVLLAAAAADRDHVRAIRKIHVKFLLKGLAKLGASHLLDQLRKCWAVCYLAQRETAGTRNFGIIVVDRAARVGLYKFRNDQKLEWLAGKRRRPEFLQIEHRKHRRTLHEHTGISS